jgi:hypothetical protein
MSVVKSVLHIHGSGYAPLLVAVSLQRVSRVGSFDLSQLGSR